MITERIVLVMLNGQVCTMENDPNHAREFYHAVQCFADVSVKLCEERKFNRLERLIGLAFKFFKEGNDTVRNAIVNVYLYTLARALDRDAKARVWIEPFMPGELRGEYKKLHYCTGL